MPTASCARERARDRVGRRAEVDREIEPSQHRRQPVGKVVRHPVDQERRRPEPRRAPAPGAQEVAIEQERLRHRHPAHVARLEGVPDPDVVSNDDLHDRALNSGTCGLPASPRAVRKPLRPLLDVALPPLCPACREPVGDAGGLCAACWSKLSFITRPYCERLGIPFAYDPGPGILSMQAIADPPAYARAPARSRATTRWRARWSTR